MKIKQISISSVVLVFTAIVLCMYGVSGAILDEKAPRSKGHGNERITVKKAENDGMQFKSIPTNETENMFQSTPKEQMNITMQEANISMTGYVSDEVKAQQSYKYYNNTNAYVTFRDKYLKGAPGNRFTAKEMARTVVLDELKKNPQYQFQTKIKQAYQSYIVFEVGQISDLRTFCDLLSHRDEVLACEFLQGKRIFGRTAHIDEMAKFKTKVKKQEPPPEPPAAPKEEEKAAPKEGEKAAVEQPAPPAQSETPASTEEELQKQRQQQANEDYKKHQQHEKPVVVNSEL